VISVLQPARASKADGSRTKHHTAAPNMLESQGHLILANMLRKEAEDEACKWKLMWVVRENNCLSSRTPDTFQFVSL
jgi:cellobiose-specific phosphotransferase system component IIA